MSNANDNGPPTWQEQLHEQSYGEGGEVTPQTSSAREASAGFDPGDHTVDEVQEYLEKHPDEYDAVMAAEAAGKNRTTLTGG